MCAFPRGIDLNNRHLNSAQIKTISQASKFETTTMSMKYQDCGKYRSQGRKMEMLTNMIKCNISQRSCWYGVGECGKKEEKQGSCSIGPIWQHWAQSNTLLSTTSAIFTGTGAINTVDKRAVTGLIPWLHCHWPQSNTSVSVTNSIGSS